MNVSRDEHPEFPFLVTHATEVGSERVVGRFATERDAEIFVTRSDRLAQRTPAAEEEIELEVTRRVLAEMTRRGELKPLIARQDDEIAADVALRVAEELEKFFALPMAEIERQAICAAVTRCGNRDDAAKALGMGVRTICSRLRSYGWAPHQKSGT